MSNTSQEIAITVPNSIYESKNLIENRYVTNGNIWTVDETIFNDTTMLFVVIDLKTRAILGYILSEDCKQEELIIELYEKILSEYKFESLPCLVHSDTEKAFHSKKVRQFLGEKNIYVSVTEGKKNQNQVSEAVNNQIKYLVASVLLEKTNSTGYRNFLKTLNESLKSIKPKEQRCRSKEFRKALFKSKFFNQQKMETIKKALVRYNKGQFSNGITRQEANYYNTFIEGQKINNTHLIESKHFLSEKIKAENTETLNRVKKNLLKIINTNSSDEQKIVEIVSFVCQRQNKTDVLIEESFKSLTLQNSVLFEQNKTLKEQIEILQFELNRAINQLEEQAKKEELIQQQRQRRNNRNKQPIKEPMTEEVYDFLISQSIKKHRETYYGARLRLALALLLVTGVRISELLNLKTNQVETLFNRSWIAIDRSKRGPSNYKAFLTAKGTKILKHRRKDFEIILQNKKEGWFIFTAQNSNKVLNRVSFNRLVNQFIIENVEGIDGKPFIRSHSFRIGFITSLWRDTKDIEFVRQAIGHAKIDTTSKYVQNLSEEERKIKMDSLQSTTDLFYD